MPENKEPWERQGLTAKVAQAGIIVAVLLLGAVLVLWYQPKEVRPTLPDKYPRVGLSNARAVAALIKQERKDDGALPLNAAAVQALIARHRLALVNVFTNHPLQVVSEGTISPGDLAYSLVGNRFYLRPLDQEGRHARGPDEVDLVVSGR